MGEEFYRIMSSRGGEMSAKKMKVGFIGLGHMGSAMARRLLQAGQRFLDTVGGRR